MLKGKLIQNILVIGSGAIFALAVYLGISAGKNQAISKIVIQNAQQIAKGMEHFKNDQDRYPTDFEFSNHDLMGSYFSVFPPASIVSSICPNSFNYSGESATSYVINFCLPKATAGYVLGWNKIISPKEIK